MSHKNSCFVIIGNCAPNVDIPPWLFADEWTQTYDIGLRVLEQLNFFDITGLTQVVAALTIDSPFDEPGTVRLEIAKRDKSVSVKYSIGKERVPNNDMQSAWKGFVVGYLADAIERVCRHFSIEPTGIEPLILLSDRLAARWQPKTEPYTVSENTADEIEIYLPYNAHTAQASKNEIAHYQEYAEKLAQRITRLGIGTVIAEESIKQAFIIAIETKDKGRAIAEIRSLSLAESTADSAWMLVTSNGEQMPLPLRTPDIGMET